MKSLPKVELHLHLEGAAPPALIRDLAGQKRMDIAGIFDAGGAYTYKDFNDFLRVYDAVTNVLNTPADYARLLTEVLHKSAEDGVVYTEVFIAPAFCGGGDLHAWRDYLAAMQETAAWVEKTAGITSRAVATVLRHLGPDNARATARCAQETAGGWLTGFGMAGMETFGKPADFRWSFDAAREAGLGLTCHAGEWGGPDSVRQAWRDLGVSRIGHGVRAIEDPALVRDLAEAGVTLECCPGSNIALGIYPNWTSHPVARLADAGCRVTISTDDPPFFHTDLPREYDHLADAFGWTEAEFSAMNGFAIDAAFCDRPTKDRVGKLIRNEETP
ncbi:adenosine deaminase [Paracoccus pacificus]|uniref:Adenosine deaminase n=1 Tax=Paracoccus pacificus TaxID=1463598 RepID=A0ABW4RBK2_9RHOB